MTQPPNHPGDNQGGTPQDPDQGGYPQQPGYPQGGFPPPQGGEYGQGGFPPPPQGGYGQGGFPPPPQGGYGQGGFPPPQGGDYGQGGFPPPPQGGYGQGGFPPPPGGGYGYGQPQFGGQAPFSIGDAFNWAWNKFTKNAVPLVVATLVFALIMLALAGAGYFLMIAAILGTTNVDAEGLTTISTTGSLTAILGSVLLVLVLGVIGSVIQACLYTGVLDITDGREVSIGSFFKPRNVGQVVIASLLLSLVAAVVSLIPFIGFVLTVVIGFLTMYLVVVIVDRGVPAIDGFKQSFELITRDSGNSILIYLIIGAIAFVGACLCGLGLLVAVPVGSLLLAYTYRRLSGGQVAPITQ